MAEESRDSRGDGRNRRRRYFKRKGEAAANAGEPGSNRPASAASSQPKRTEPGRQAKLEPKANREEGQGAPPRSRNLRKRRRSRSRRSDAQTARSTALPIEREEAYTPPQNVYIYEHVVRPSAGSYEFRSESFSKAGRTLDDYTLELDTIFNPPEREPVGQIIARVFAEFEAADELEAAHAARMAPLAEDEIVTPLTSPSSQPVHTSDTDADEETRADNADLPTIPPEN